MKTRQKILLTALSAALIATMTSGLAITALADETTKDHEFDAKQDVVFEDFDRADISDTVKASDTGADIGEKPYLHVVYTAGKSITTAGAIYKHGSGSLAQLNSGGTITFKMRAPQGDVTLSELKFGVRGVDSEDAVLIKPMTELKTSENDDLPELTANWQEYEIGFATSYEPDEKYPTTEQTFGATPVLAIHLFAADAAATGTLDIASVTYNQTVINDFRGGDTVDVTAKVADAGLWWAGSAEGYIVKRAVKLTAGGNFTVVKANAVGDYKYAIIEADGDTENLKVATTEDGTTWGEAAAYDGYSVALTGKEKGFKFSYEGTAEGGVTVRRIYLTNNVTRAPATAVPVIDASSAQALEDFSVAQSGISGVWEDMSTAPELAKAGLDYRLSYSNNNAVETKVEVKDGCLVFDATDLTADSHTDYINFKFKSKKVVNGKYVVFKMKAEGGANLDTFRFKLGSPEDQYGTEVWSHSFKAAYEFNTPFLTEANPYKADDWYYVVVDIEESGFETYEAGYSGMDLYLGGTGKLYIDAIFFADKVDMVPTDCVKTVMNEAGDAPFTLDFQGTADTYQYACEVKGLDGTPDFYNALAVEIETTAGTDLSGVRFECKNGIRWAGGLGNHDAEGYLYLTDGTLLADAGFVAGQAKTVYIDLEKSNITLGNFHIHTNGKGTGSFKINSMKLVSLVEASEQKAPDSATAYVVKNEAGDADFTLDFNATSTDGYQYACEVKGLDALTETYDVLAIEFVVPEGTDLSGVRFAIGSGEYWAGGLGTHDEKGYLFLTDGTLLADTEFVAGQAKTVYVDLAKSGITLGTFHIHTNGTATGSFKINSMKLMKFTTAPTVAERYEEELDKIPAHLDATPPQVTISTATTAKAGDEITVSYTATDDVTAATDLTVTVSVTKDGEAVALTGNKFKAAEGVYTVTVTARDANGNEGSATIQITVAAQQGGTEPGGTTPGGTTPGGTEPGGTTPGGTEPGGTEPGGTEPGGTTPGGTEPGGTEPGGTTPGGSDKDDGGLSTGAIVGIVIGAVAGVALICVIVLVVIKKKKH